MSRDKVKHWYHVTRFASPYEWSIEKVPIGHEKLDPSDNGEVFETWLQAKTWLIDQTQAWIEGFRDDMAEIRKLKKSSLTTVN